MKKAVKIFVLFILIVAVAFLNYIGYRAYAAGNENSSDAVMPYQGATNFANVYNLLSSNAKVYYLLRDTANVYGNMLVTSRVYRELLSGKLHGNFGGGPLPEGVNPKFYNNIPISGSLASQEMDSHGPYTSCDWIYVSINWTPADSPLTVVIYDNTALCPVASRSGTNNSISVWTSVKESHYYSVFIFNDGSRDRISYYGKIVLLQK